MVEGISGVALSAKRCLTVGGSMLASAMMACVGSAAANAQESGLAAEGNHEDATAQRQMDVIIVTAEKVEQNLQDVPISIAAFRGDRIEKSGARSVEDIQFLAAGLNFGTDRDGVLRTSIRGISSNVGNESAVATHRDGVYLADRYDQISAFFDLERVEVLRGPQGTLYGRNATGGAINIITKDPTSAPEAGLKLTVGNYGLIATEGFGSGPLGNSVRGRIAFKSTSLDGYGRNLSSGEGVNGNSLVAGRAKLDFEISDNSELQLAADYADRRSTTANEVSRAFAELPLLQESTGFVLARGFDSNRTRPTFQSVEAYGGHARLNWDIGFATLTSLTGYRRISTNTPLDVDGNPFEIVHFAFNKRRAREITQELNLSSSGGQALTWIVGAFYFNNRLSGAYDVVLPVFGDFVIRQELIKYDTDAFAVFGQATYDLTQDLSFTVGARYSDETSEDLETRQFLINGEGALLTQELSNSASSFTPKVSLLLRATDDINLYATYAKGFKAGGLNPGLFDGSDFKPERVTNYEIGLKSLLFGRNLMLNVSAFYMDYTDLQVNSFVVIPPGIPALQIVNAAAANIKGVEAEFNVLLGSRFSIDGNVALLDANYTDFDEALDPIGPTSFPFTEPLGARTRSASGNRVVSSPEFSANLGAEYTLSDVGDWTPTLRGEFSYQSRIYFTPFEGLRNTSQPPVSVINAQLEFANERDGWTIAIWGRNLTDELMVSNLVELAASQGPFQERNYRPPQTYGFTLGKEF